MNDSADPRRRVPRTDVLLAHPDLAPAAEHLGRDAVKAVIAAAQARARAGEIAPDDVLDIVLATLPPRATSMTPVLNATGVVVHTNLGRAPLSEAARDAILAAAGYVDVELDLATGARGRRGAAVTQALIKATGAEDALVLNNGAAALLLATVVLAGPGSEAGHRGSHPGGCGEVIISRGELVEIGAGFRIPDLVASTGVYLREVGTTNRTHPADYAGALTSATAAILKVHPSNFRVEGFTSGVGVPEIARIAAESTHPVRVIADIGSGLLTHDPALPDEPDARTSLGNGADLVTCSGDKLLGGPQAGIAVGRADLVEAMRRHPMARALRPDKLALAALEATLTGPEPPVTTYRHLTADQLHARTLALAERVGGEVVPSTGRVGGGGAPGVELPGWAVALPEWIAAPLRHGSPAVLARTEKGRCLVDLRCVPPAADSAIASAILTARTSPAGSA